MERAGLAIKRMFMPSAILASLYVNAHLPASEPRVIPEDFLPGAKSEDLPAVAPEVLSIMRRKAMEAHNRRIAK